jgi:hypothetical protein
VVGPVGLEPTTSGLKGYRCPATTASTSNYGNAGCHSDRTTAHRLTSFRTTTRTTQSLPVRDSVVSSSRPYSTRHTRRRRTVALPDAGRSVLDGGEPSAEEGALDGILGQQQRFGEGGAGLVGPAEPGEELGPWAAR